MGSGYRNLDYKTCFIRIVKPEFLNLYFEEFGEDRTEAKNLLSHKDIANLTNTSRQTVNNVLSNMRKTKKINYDTKYISVVKNKE